MCHVTVAYTNPLILNATSYIIQFLEYLENSGQFHVQCPIFDKIEVIDYRKSLQKYSKTKSNTFFLLKIEKTKTTNIVNLEDVRNARHERLGDILILNTNSFQRYSTSQASPI